MTAISAPRRWTLPVAVFGGWLIIGLVSTSLSYSTMQAEHLPVGFGRALVLGLPYWLFWPLVTPIIVWLARQAPPGAERLPRSLAIHLAASIAIGALHSALYMAINQLWFPFPGGASPSFGVLLDSYLKNRWQLELLVYWAILGGALAISYYREGQERSIRASRLEAQLAQSQLQALRMQLHPHFLFNTLQAISVLTVENPRAAQKMLTQLGDLLRAVLDGDERQEIPLEEELGFLRRYLDIEQVRFPDRLSVTFDVAPQALDAMVPSFVLQPLVENAIRYAIAPSAAPGRIDIVARTTDGRVQLIVRDSGPGFPQPIDEGVGLATTRARLEKLHGTNQRMILGRSTAGGAEAVIDLPLRTDMEGANDGR